jgi:hypothetical protein
MQNNKRVARAFVNSPRIEPFASPIRIAIDMNDMG